ncbi:MAG: symmetrical bis(5'-nucleosyl)-tetraphosphatase [Planctomycetota bacterium]
MATFAVGDVQGCRETLEALLDRCGFRPDRDRLWFVGDLVNRGPDSLGVLRLVRELGEAAVAVLGNHDLHLLAVAHDLRPTKPQDTFHDVLEAPDREDLLDWLRRRPILHREWDHVLVHAGLHPAWPVKLADTLARGVEAALKGSEFETVLARSYDAGLDRWEPKLDETERLATAIRVFAKMRVVRGDGRIDHDFTGDPEECPPGTRPWFLAEGRATADLTIVFGHWAALGYREAPGILALDSGCVWGGELTAVRLEDRSVWQVGRTEPIEGD